MKKTPSASSSSNSAGCAAKAECRLCAGRKLARFLSLGPQPLANSFVKPRDAGRDEPFFPLDVRLCESCGLVQLADVVEPELMFKDYLYVSSTSPVFVAHFEKFAGDVWKALDLQEDDLVVDVGSNDGILLKPFQALGAQALGVDPAENVARMATEAGVDTLCAFFGPDAARAIVDMKGRAKAVTACNVFAHVDDLDGFLEGLDALLDDDGVFMPEFPYLVDFFEKNLFDTVYHEHLSYLALKPLVPFFEKRGFEVFDAWRVGSHGGSLRLFVQRKGGNRPVSKAVGELLALEDKLGLSKLAPWKAFAERVERNKDALVALLLRLKEERRSILGYGAPAKGNTLLNYFRIGPGLVDAIVDDSPLKQGLLTPGTHIPVVAPSEIEARKPDYILILAWNFAEPIMKKLAPYAASGGKFIVPVPEPKVIG
jgi:SAM-dependent methyltransferase